MPKAWQKTVENLVRKIGQIPYLCTVSTAAGAQAAKFGFVYTFCTLLAKRFPVFLPSYFYLPVLCCVGRLSTFTQQTTITTKLI